MGISDTMINVTSNINAVVSARMVQLQQLGNNPDPILRTVALTVLPELRKRVHVDGRDSSGGQIGRYSPGYMKVRTGKYNRKPDTQVVLSLTRQMENDLSVIANKDGYGIGYLNPFNYQKALWCEETYGKPILTKLTEGEVELAVNTAREFVTDYLKTF
jgi:hypothetical protein